MEGSRKMAAITKSKHKWMTAGAIVAFAQVTAFAAFYFSVWVLKYLPAWLLWGTVTIVFLPGGLMLLPVSGTGFAHMGLWFFAVAAVLSWIIYTMLLGLVLSRTRSRNEELNR
jgi:hypothetical protein